LWRAFTELYVELAKPAKPVKPIKLSKALYKAPYTPCEISSAEL
jgi:hypothetical protein